MKIKTLIIEDEAAARRTLKGLLELFAPEVDIIAEADSVLLGITGIKQFKPDLIFLDMELKGEKGLLVLDHFENIDFEVIVTTAHSQFALPSYEFGVTDYLLKPITPSLLKRGMVRVEERLRLKQIEANKKNERKDELRLPNGRDEKRFPIENVIRIEANRNYSWVHSTLEKPFLTPKNLAVLEEILLKHQFIRVHHSHLINIWFIERFNKHDNMVELKDGSLLPVSRERRKALKSILENE